MISLKRAVACLATAMTVALMAGSPALAAEGTIEINQTRALAGGVTPGDTPGFPVTLSQPGSYKLTSNLLVPNQNSDGIHITALSDVNLDLGGFAIVGVVTCTGFGSTISCGTGTGIGIQSGIPLLQGSDNVRITNGTVTGMGAEGIRLIGNQSRLEGLSLIGNGARGLIGGTAARVVACIVSGNGGDGMRVGVHASVVDNVVLGNGGHGIDASGSATIIQGNAIASNGANGILADFEVLILANAIRSNGALGLEWPGTFGGTAPGGYARNVIDANTGGSVSASGLQLGTNFCNGNTTCP